MAEKYPKLIDPKVTISLMQELGLSTKKKFGQNFLIDERVLGRIIDGAGITKEDTVLEIGPGVGTMTQALSERAGRVIAVEIDSDLIPVLQKTLAGYDNVTVINKDVLEVDLKTMDGLLGDRAGTCGTEPAEASGFSASGEKRDCGKDSYKVVANLPYYITTPIIMKLLESGAPIENITVMVQKEVADRMQAAPGGKDYGALSVAVQYYCEPEVIANVPQNCFIPRPNVDSAVICLKKREHPEIVKAFADDASPVTVKEPAFMFKVVRAAFAQRRKTLVNGLKNDSAIGVSREKTEKVLHAVGLDANIRGERLSVKEFALLSNKIRE